MYDFLYAHASHCLRVGLSRVGWPRSSVLRTADKQSLSAVQRNWCVRSVRRPNWMRKPSCRPQWFPSFGCFIADILLFTHRRERTRRSSEDTHRISQLTFARCGSHPRHKAHQTLLISEPFERRCSAREYVNDSTASRHTGLQNALYIIPAVEGAYSLQ